MKSTKIVTLLLGCVCASVLCGGCVGRAIKEGMGAATGGKGICQPVGHQPSLSGYSYKIGDFESVYPKLVPAGFERQLDNELKKHLADKAVPMASRSSTKVLVIGGKITYYEVAGTSGELFGPLEEVVADVTLTDPETGKVVARSVCAGRTTATTTRGTRTKAEGLADAIAKWIVSKTPELKNRDDK